MPRRSNYDLDAIRAVSDVECPHCNVMLNPAEYLRLDDEWRTRQEEMTQHSVALRDLVNEYSLNKLES